MGALRIVICYLGLQIEISYLDWGLGNQIGIWIGDTDLGIGIMIGDLDRGLGLGIGIWYWDRNWYID